MNRVFWLVVGLLLFACVFSFLHFFSTPYDECTIEERIVTHDGVIEIVNAQCKEGMPHTTDADTIRMTREAYTSEQKDSTLVHERVHLSQKRNPEAWKSFYKQYWKYDLSLTPPLEMPEIYARMLRPNPDTSDSPWVTWENRYVFFPNSFNGTLKHAKVVVWDSIVNKEVPIPAKWKEFFCSSEGRCPSQYEHPHELSAEFLTHKQQSTASSYLFSWIKGQK